MESRRWDAIIVGAGPAGSACAAFLAMAGHRVLVLEKEHFPRFQIGESLLPASLPVLAKLGIEPDPDSHVYKRGAEFVCESSGRQTLFNFAGALGGPPRHAWQVDRATFDLRIRDRAEALGATVRHGEKVVSVAIESDEVRVKLQHGAEECGRYLVDATGQNRLMARHFGSATPYDGFGRAAAFVHYDGLSDAAIDEIGVGNDIRVLIRPEGWGWIIPLPNRRLSVGLVVREGAPVEALEHHLATSPLIERWTRGAKRGETRTARNFSFKNESPNGPRYACVGDAACFLDPVFSSGVTLALVAAEHMTRLLSPALTRGTECDAGLMTSYADFMSTGYRAFSSIIDRFYHTHFVDHFIFGAEEEGEIKQGVVSVLAGDVWREDNRFQQMLLGSRRQRDVAAESSGSPKS